MLPLETFDYKPLSCQASRAVEPPLRFKEPFRLRLRLPLSKYWDITNVQKLQHSFQNFNFDIHGLVYYLWFNILFYPFHVFAIAENYNFISKNWSLTAFKSLFVWNVVNKILLNTVLGAQTALWWRLRLLKKSRSQSRLAPTPALEPCKHLYENIWFSHPYL